MEANTLDIESRVMSWMDSWSRPSKSQATPTPFYLTQGDQVPYCHTCGRAIGARRAHSSKATIASEIKYCSDKCKRRKPSSAPTSRDGRIEAALEALLEGRAVPVEGDEEVEVKPRCKPKKGDPRIVVKLSEIEMAVFGDRSDPEKVYGRKKNRRMQCTPERGKWTSVDMEEGPPAPVVANSGDAATADPLFDDANDNGEAGGGVRINSHHVRALQSRSEVNFSVGGERGWAEKIEETPEMLAKRREGQQRAEERELVRNAARRAVAFGIWTQCATPESAAKQGEKGRERAQNESERRRKRKCEALMSGQVVEPSFAKGDWEIRFREE